jgi:hypothetical protein
MQIALGLLGIACLILTTWLYQLTAYVQKIAVATDNNAGVTKAHHLFIQALIEEAKKEGVK